MAASEAAYVYSHLDTEDEAAWQIRAVGRRLQGLHQDFHARASGTRRGLPRISLRRMFLTAWW